MSALRPVDATAATVGAAGVATWADAIGFSEAGDAGACADGWAAAVVSISATTAPSDSASPTFTFNSLTTPANGDGTSIVALSDSSVTRPWSFFTVSPTATNTSITGTSL